MFQGPANTFGTCTRFSMQGLPTLSLAFPWALPHLPAYFTAYTQRAHVGVDRVPGVKMQRARRGLRYQCDYTGSRATPAPTAMTRRHQYRCSGATTTTITTTKTRWHGHPHTNRNDDSVALPSPPDRNDDKQRGGAITTPTKTTTTTTIWRRGPPNANHPTTESSELEAVKNRYINIPESTVLYGGAQLYQIRTALDMDGATEPLSSLTWERGGGETALSSLLSSMWERGDGGDGGGDTALSSSRVGEDVERERVPGRRQPTDAGGGENTLSRVTCHARSKNIQVPAIGNLEKLHSCGNCPKKGDLQM
ncbi:hypothetical protein EV363DRAFT_1293836 [Boletus edulis]|nr:hypothetical protein EV363DRAFT_1293836 [Boletus edulis]